MLKDIIVVKCAETMSYRIIGLSNMLFNIAVSGLPFSSAMNQLGLIKYYSC